MPNERISMSKLKQLIGLQSSNLSIRAWRRALGLSVGAVSKYLRAVRAAGSTPRRPKRSRRWNSSSACSGRRWRAKPRLCGAGLRLDPRGTQASSARDAAAAVGGIRGPVRRGGVPAQRFLPNLPALGEAPEALDAPAPLRRREAVRRLRRSHGADLWGTRRGGVPGAPVRQRHGRERLRVCGGHAQRVAAGLAR